MKSEFFKEWIQPILVALIAAGIAWALKEFWRTGMNKHLISLIITFSPIIIGFFVFCFYWIIKDYLKLRHSIQYSKNGGKGKETDLLRKEINDLKKWIGLFSYKDKYSNLKGKIKLYISEELEKNNLRNLY